ncbi:MAG: JAB domain-containing protein [Steroidobacteraceae bacterium]
MTATQERIRFPEVPVYRVALVRERTLPATRAQVRCPQDIADVVADYLADADREHLVAVLLDTKNRVIGIETVAVGTLDGAPAHPREVFKSAILANAAALALAHNHPSGDPTPSPEDRAVTRRMAQAGKVLGIPLHDHIVVDPGSGRFVSMRAEGMIE